MGESDAAFAVKNVGPLLPIVAELVIAVQHASVVASRRSLISLSNCPKAYCQAAPRAQPHSYQQLTQGWVSRAANARGSVGFTLLLSDHADTAVTVRSLKTRTSCSRRPPRQSFSAAPAQQSGCTPPPALRHAARLGRNPPTSQPGCKHHGLRVSRCCVRVMPHLEIEPVQCSAVRQERRERHWAVAAGPGDANLSLR